MWRLHRRIVRWIVCPCKPHIKLLARFDRLLITYSSVCTTIVSTDCLSLARSLHDSCRFLLTDYALTVAATACHWGLLNRLAIVMAGVKRYACRSFKNIRCPLSSFNVWGLRADFAYYVVLIKQSVADFRIHQSSVLKTSCVAYVWLPYENKHSPVRRISRGQVSSRNLRYQISPEERTVDQSNCAGWPVKLWFLWKINKTHSVISVYCVHRSCTGTLWCFVNKPMQR